MGYGYLALAVKSEHDKYLVSIDTSVDERAIFHSNVLFVSNKSLDALTTVVFTLDAVLDDPPTKLITSFPLVVVPQATLPSAPCSGIAIVFNVGVVKDVDVSLGAGVKLVDQIDIIPPLKGCPYFSWHPVSPCKP